MQKWVQDVRKLIADLPGEATQEELGWLVAANCGTMTDYELVWRGASVVSKIRRRSHGLFWIRADKLLRTLPHVTNMGQ